VRNRFCKAGDTRRQALAIVRASTRGPPRHQHAEIGKVTEECASGLEPETSVGGENEATEVADFLVPGSRFPYRPKDVFERGSRISEHYPFFSCSLSVS
jgi:hypothetical protein